MSETRERSPWGKLLWRLFIDLLLPISVGLYAYALGHSTGENEAFRALIKAMDKVSAAEAPSA